MAELVRYEVEQGVAHLELNRPDVANSFDLETSEVFGRVIGQLAADQSVRAVLLSGAGSRFSTGGDWTVPAFAHSRE